MSAGLWIVGVNLRLATVLVRNPRRWVLVVAGPAMGAAWAQMGGLARVRGGELSQDLFVTCAGLVFALTAALLNTLRRVPLLDIGAAGDEATQADRDLEDDASAAFRGLVWAGVGATGVGVAACWSSPHGQWDSLDSSMSVSYAYLGYILGIAAVLMGQLVALSLLPHSRRLTPKRVIVPRPEAGCAGGWMTVAAVVVGGACAAIFVSRPLGAAALLILPVLEGWRHLSGSRFDPRRSMPRCVAAIAAKIVAAAGRPPRLRPRRRDASAAASPPPIGDRAKPAKVARRFDVATALAFVLPPVAVGLLVDEWGVFGLPADPARARGVFEVLLGVAAVLFVLFSVAAPEVGTRSVPTVVGGWFGLSVVGAGTIATLLVGAAGVARGWLVGVGLTGIIEMTLAMGWVRRDLRRNRFGVSDPPLGQGIADRDRFGVSDPRLGQGIADRDRFGVSESRLGQGIADQDRWFEVSESHGWVRCIARSGPLPRSQMGRSENERRSPSILASGQACRPPPRRSPS